MQTVWHGATWREHYQPIEAPPLPPPVYAPKVKTYAKATAVMRAIGDEVVSKVTIMRVTGLTEDQVRKVLTAMVRSRQLQRVGRVRGFYLYRKAR